MSGFEVDPTELFAAGARVSESAADGRGSLERIRLEAADLFGGGWVGAAGAAFREGVDEWLTGARSMLSGLDDLSSALSAAGHDYAGSEQVTRSSFEGIGIAS